MTKGKGNLILDSSHRKSNWWQKRNLQETFINTYNKR